MASKTFPKERRYKDPKPVLFVFLVLVGCTLAGVAYARNFNSPSVDEVNLGGTTPRALGNNFYVAPEGTSDGDGSIEKPWDLATALDHPAVIQPGDTVWLRGGVYTGSFLSSLTGTEEAPIVVRQYPGERAVLDRALVSEEQLPALKVKGPWVWFWGFEIMNSNTGRGRSDPYTGSDEPWRGSGADVYASNIKFINMIFHDNGHGIWDKRDMTEIYGCMFYYNGNNKREHALYLGNTNGTKYIVDNIIFSQAGYGILAYSGATPNSLNGFHIEGNATFNNGIITADDQTAGNIQVGGGPGVSAERIVVKDNFVYNPIPNATGKNCGIRLGYEDTGNKDLKLLNNYIVSKVPLRVWWWENIESQGNTVYSRSYSTDFKTAPGVEPLYSWDLNSYLSGRKSGPVFLADEVTRKFASWQETTKFDRNSQVLHAGSLRPEGVKTFIRPNRYEAKRGHVIIYNWDLVNWMTLDLSTLGFHIGDTYSVFDVQNYFGGPVASGTYDGYEILLPLKLQEVSQPIGNVERVPSHTSPEFAVFLVREGL